MKQDCIYLKFSTLICSNKNKMQTASWKIKFYIYLCLCDSKTYLKSLEANESRSITYVTLLLFLSHTQAFICTSKRTPPPDSQKVFCEHQLRQLILPPMFSLDPRSKAIPPQSLDADPPFPIKCMLGVQEHTADRLTLQITCCRKVSKSCHSCYTWFSAPAPSAPVGSARYIFRSFVFFQLIFDAFAARQDSHVRQSPTGLLLAPPHAPVRL